MLRFPRNSWAMSLGLLVSLLGTLAPATYAEEPWEASRQFVESMAKQIVTRLDQSQAGKKRSSDAETAVTAERAALDESEMALNLAKIALREYSEGIFPLDFQTIQGEVGLCTSEMERAKQALDLAVSLAKTPQIKTNQLLTAKGDHQKAEIALKNAKMKLEVLQKYSKEKETERLVARIKKAKTDVSMTSMRVKATIDLLAAAQREETDSRLSAAESKAAAVMTEALDLYDSGKTEPALAKLIEAEKAWGIAQSERAEAQFKVTRQRLKIAAVATPPAK